MSIPKLGKKCANKASYEGKFLTVFFDDGETESYQMSEAAAHAMLSSGSLQHHFEKYIDGIYFPLSQMETR